MNLDHNIDLLIGPYRSGKTLALLERVIDHCQKYPEKGATIVVPSHRYRLLLEDRLANYATGQANNLAGLFGLRIITFYQYCERLLHRLGHFEKVIPDSVRPSLLNQILTKMNAAQELHWLKPIINFGGTSAALLELIDELERSGNKAADVLSGVKKKTSEDSRYKELAQIYANYWQSLDSLGQIDKRRLSYKLIDLLEENESAIKASKEDLLAFDGFDRFNPLQLKLINALAKHSQKIVISFDYLAPAEDIEQEYLWKQASYDELTKILQDKLEICPIALPEKKGQDLKVEKFTAPDRYIEMTAVASAIKKSLENNSKSSKDFLVVARNLNKYKGAVQAAFADAGLPYFLEEAISLTTLPLIQFLLTLLSLAEEDFPYAKTLFCLRSQYFKCSIFGLSSEMIDRLDWLSQERSITGGKKQWLDACDKSQYDDLSRNLQSFFTAVVPINKTAEAYVAWIENLIEKVLIRKHDFDTDPWLVWEQENALMQFKSALVNIIQEEAFLKEINSAATTEEYFKKLKTLVEAANFQRLPTVSNYILITSAELAPNRLFDEIYLVGLVEGEFPAVPKQNGFTNTDEVNVWSNFNIDIHNPRYHSNFESALFLSLLKRARKQITISYPLSEMSGKAAEMPLPSFLFNTIGKESKIAFEQPLQSLLAKPNSPRNALASHFWKSNNPLPDYFDNQSQIANLVADLDEPLAMAKKRNQSAIGPLNGYLVDFVSTGVAQVSLPRYWSASRLSDYAKCPFRFWVSHILKKDLLEEPEAGLSYRLRGETYHKALEIFYRKVIASGLSLKNEEHVSQLEECLNDALASAFNWLTTLPDFRPDEFFDYHCLEMSFRLKRFLQEERKRAVEATEDFIPVMAEVNFGIDPVDNAPALPIVCGEHEIFIRGRVDRIDMSSGFGEQPRLRIIDYKSGSASISMQEAISGRSLQLPLYTLAAENVIMPKSKVVMGEYLSIASAKATGKINFEQPSKAQRELPDADLLKHTKELISKFVTNIKAGDFTLKPSKSSVCQDCNHQTICRIAESRSSEGEDDYETD